MTRIEQSFVNGFRKAAGFNPYSEDPGEGWAAAEASYRKSPELQKAIKQEQLREQLKQLQKGNTIQFLKDMVTPSPKVPEVLADDLSELAAQYSPQDFGLPAYQQPTPYWDAAEGKGPPQGEADMLSKLLIHLGNLKDSASNKSTAAWDRVKDMAGGAWDSTKDKATAAWDYSKENPYIGYGVPAGLSAAALAAVLANKKRKSNKKNK